MASWHLARTETIDANLVLHVGKALIHLSFHVSGRNDDLEFALQPFSERFNNLHVLTFVSWRPCFDSRWFHGGCAQTANLMTAAFAAGSLL
ncbi:hypothetical protein [Rhizobium sp.]|uniref:hypothetical protein n=1 Tax=Rhizobium sp. TaxID=391 RepID=UPI002AA8B1FC